MKTTVIFLFCILIANGARAQSLKKYPLGKSGCYAYFYCNPGTFTAEKSPDSSEVFTGECSTGDVFYGAICVKLKDKYSDMQVSEDMLASYLDYLKTELKIKIATGYRKGIRLKGKENTRGITDYWQSSDGDNWKVKGWTNGKYIAVLYVSAKKELPETKANAFLDSLVFATR